VGNIFNTILFYPFLNVLLAIYHILGDNLGLAIILFAIVVRLALIPLTKKQTDMTKKMSTLQPELAKLQKKYANNQQKLSEEQMKLYKKVGYNPLGCIGSMVPQLIILYALFGVIKAMSTSAVDGIYPFIKEWIFGSGNVVINTNFLWWNLEESYNAIAQVSGRFSTEALPYFILCLLVGVSQYFSTDFSQKIQKIGVPEVKRKKNEPMSQQEMQEKSNKYMMAMLPLMTVFIAFSSSSAIAVYWVVQSFALVIQYLLLDVKKSKSFLKNGFLGKIFKKKEIK
jgi:YidC/Oxa1 family membrane protein insertase